MANALLYMEPGKKVDLIDITKREFVLFGSVINVKLLRDREPVTLLKTPKSLSEYVLSKLTGCIWWKSMARLCLKQRDKQAKYSSWYLNNGKIVHEAVMEKGFFFLSLRKIIWVISSDPQNNTLDIDMPLSLSVKANIFF